MKLTLKIEKITLYKREFGPDIILVCFDGPPTYPNSDDKPRFQIEVQKGSGFHYIYDLFGVEPNGIEVIAYY